MNSSLKPLLVNRYEHATFGELQRVVDELGLAVFPKVRVADVLPIETKRPPSELFSYALASHFDFVVCRGVQPEYAVEFDGPSHFGARQAANDRKKNWLCKEHGLPLLQIDSRHIEPKWGKTTLLAWIMEVRELEVAFYEAQRQGQVPWDEPFDPLAFWTLDDRRNPYWLSRDARIRWRHLADRGEIRDYCSSGGQWHDDNETMYGLEYIRITPTHGIHVATWMRWQSFPELPTLLEEVLLLRLDEQIDLYLAGKRSLEPLADIRAKVKRFESRYERGQSHSFSKG